jgi:hypothetical protein
MTGRVRVVPTGGASAAENPGRRATRVASDIRIMIGLRAGVLVFGRGDKMHTACPTPEIARN